MANRKDNLLAAIVEEYAKTAMPVGSKMIAANPDFKVSSATIRNDMAKLEKAGLITHPYPSAGRIPTEKGYQYYIDNFLVVEKLPAKEKRQLANALTGQPRESAKNLAKILAMMSGLGILVAFSPNDIYYTGISNIFAQPEFYSHDLVCNMSTIIDHLDKSVDKVFDKIGNEIEILIGRNNPFGQDCSVILTKYDLVLIGILGPIRMDYKRVYSLLSAIKEG